MTPKLMALAAVVVLTVVFLEPCRVTWRGSVPPLAIRARGRADRPLARAVDRRTRTPADRGAPIAGRSAPGFGDI